MTANACAQVLPDAAAPCPFPSTLAADAPTPRRTLLLRGVRLGALAVVGGTFAGCATLTAVAPKISLAGIEKADGSEGLDTKMVVKLRVQNPNPEALAYDGIALDLDIAGRPVASGQTDAQGEVPRYGESIIKIPVTVSAASVIKQFFGVAGNALKGDPSVPYTIRGRVGGGMFGPRSFKTDGVFRLSY